MKEVIFYLKGNANIDVYDPIKFMRIATYLKDDYKTTNQQCSQDFIRILLNYINKELIGYRDVYQLNEYRPSKGKEIEKYDKFCKQIFPESLAFSLFTIISKAHSYGKFNYCNEIIEDYTFSYNIDQILYLDKCRKRVNFFDVFDLNFLNGTINIDSPKCHKNIEIKEKNTIIKLPEILIFTLERFFGVKKIVSIENPILIDLKNYIDIDYRPNRENTIYELFAVNLRLGKDIKIGHQICIIKREGIWYEINDEYVKKCPDFIIDSLRENSYGLFYKKLRL